jgi:hypothetical protein
MGCNMLGMALPCHVNIRAESTPPGFPLEQVFYNLIGVRASLTAMTGLVVLIEGV